MIEEFQVKRDASPTLAQSEVHCKGNVPLTKYPDCRPRVYPSDAEPRRPSISYGVPYPNAMLPRFQKYCRGSESDRWER